MLSRLRAVVASPKHTALNKWSWKAAGDLVDPQRPGDFNQVGSWSEAVLDVKDDALCSPQLHRAVLCSVCVMQLEPADRLCSQPVACSTAAPLTCPRICVCRR